MNSFYSPQIGFTQSGNGNQSKIVLGRSVGATWEAVGFGAQGRPDVLEVLQINLATPSGTLSQKGRIDIDVSHLVSIIDGNVNAPNPMVFQMREFDVCDNGQPKKVVILASANYNP